LQSVTSGNSTVSYNYLTNGALNRLTAPSGTVYGFAYDTFGRTSSIAIGNRILSSTEYLNNHSSLVNKFTYGNGVYKNYTYDNLDRVLTESINGTQVVSYTYGAWGDVLSVSGTLASTVGQQNPLRYRGYYYYDGETGFYYLQSRYYDTVTQRFVNGDSIIAGINGNILGYNQFSYCFNNPINMSDSFGNWAKWLNDIINRIKAITQLIMNNFTVQYDVPLYNQGNFNLCWAYSQAMIEDSLSGINRTPIEADARAREIAIDKHGSENWDRGSKPNGITKIKNNSLLSLAVSLQIHCPLYASYGLYIDGKREQGHAIVVTGVNLIEKRVYTNNPWGITGDQSYDEFLNIFIGETNTNWKLDSCYYLE